MEIEEEMKVDNDGDSCREKDGVKEEMKIEEEKVFKKDVKSEDPE